MKKTKQRLRLLLKHTALHIPSSLHLLSRVDVKLGAIGYSVMLTDALAEAGNVQRARFLVVQNLFQLLESTKPRKKPRKGLVGRKKVKYLGIPQATKLDTLRRITNALEQHDIRPFLAFGTLLGMVREHRFMLHDGDMDLGILTSEATAETVKPLFERLGFYTTLLEQDEHGPWPCRLKVENHEGLAVDLVFFHSSQQHLLTYSKYFGELLIRKRTPFGLKEADFLGIQVWIPDPPDQFLMENYGNWQQRAAFYDHIVSSNLTDHTLDVVKYRTVRCLYRLLTLGEYDKAQGLIHQMLERKIDKAFWIDISDKFTAFLAKE